MERCIWGMKKLCTKKARRFHTLEPWATKPYLNKFKSPSKAYVKTAHAVCESTKLFLDMERFHNVLDGNWSFQVRDYIVLISIRLYKYKQFY